MLRVNEFFGPTFQGEGPFIGQLAHFLRLNRCNLTCSWCDTPYTWAHTPAKAAKHQSGILYDIAENETEWSLEQTLAVLGSNDVRFLVVSGGEPLLQREALSGLVVSTDIRIQFETAGTLPPLEEGPEDNVFYVVSPKLENSGNLFERRFKPDVLKQFVKREANFKFVATSPRDLGEIGIIVEEVGIPNERVWVMPEGTIPSEMMANAKELADPTLGRGWNMTLRMHTLLWGDERGR